MSEPKNNNETSKNNEDPESKGKPCEGSDKVKQEFPGYPSYPKEDDIYQQATEESDLDPDNPGHKKAPNEFPDARNEKNKLGDYTGGDLDVPGTELDDVQENIGSEDEENNNYSLGGDDKEANEESQGD